MIEEEIIGSHTEESEQHDTGQDAELNEALKAFNIEPVEEKEEKSVNDMPPAKEEVTPETKIEKVRHNKEETEVDISTKEKLHDHLQRSLALDKERERKVEYEKALDRVAKQQGYKDHSDLIANLDQIEQKQIQQQKDQFEQMEHSVYQQLIENGVDEQAARDYVLNNPLLAEAKAAIQEKEQAKAQRDNEIQSQVIVQGWQELYSSYPDIMESAKAFNEGESPDWYTPRMQEMVNRGYTPKDAYELAHRDTLQSQTKRATEQRMIKEQQLGLRSRVETNTTPDAEPQVSAELASAFAAFGLPAESAKKYIKK